ncbi:MAG: site-2 protease family protein [Alphaproteobacteria bacterium]|jgi:Zn-dependent protease|nr:site-2 protease family protein [Alphaproteobacteria bacterium]|tara:strand:- start:3204 stop:3881 length:678 start_codon:yes stop_codon:yes gene_type:complete
MNETLHTISVMALPIVIAIVFHEVAHGYVAWRLGDDTAHRQGRITLNPLRHIDPFGTIILPLILALSVGFPFGYAKPVPVNPGRLRHPRRDMVLVAAAGPATNVVLAIAASLLLHGVNLLPPAAALWLGQNLLNAIPVNLILAIFNMLPLPPLDGGRVAVGLLPDALAYRLARLERFGFLILIAVIVVLPMAGKQLGYPLDPLGAIIWPPLEFLYNSLAVLTGHT